MFFFFVWRCGVPRPQLTRTRARMPCSSLPDARACTSACVHAMRLLSLPRTCPPRPRPRPHAAEWRSYVHCVRCGCGYSYRHTSQGRLASHARHTHRTLVPRLCQWVRERYDSRSVCAQTADAGHETAMQDRESRTNQNQRRAGEAQAPHVQQQNHVPQSGNLFRQRTLLQACQNNVCTTLCSV